MQQLQNDLLSRKQVAEYFGITFPTLKKLVDDGQLTAYKLGKRRVYFKAAEVQTSLKQVSKTPETAKEVVDGN